MMASRSRNSAGLFASGGRAWTVLGVLLLATAAWAEFQLFDDFEDETLGPVVGQDGWSGGGGDNRVVADPADPFNQVLCVPSASSVLRKALVGAGRGVPDSTSRVLFMRMRVAEKQTFSVGLSPWTSPSEYSDFGPELGMANNAPNLDLRVWDDDGGNYEVLTSLTADTWVNIWVRVDTDLNESAIWLNVDTAWAVPADKLGAGDGDETFEFRTGQNHDMVTFYIKTSGGSSGFGPAYFDDIYLETTETLNLCNPAGPPLGDCDGSGSFEIDEAVVAGACLLGPTGLGPSCVCYDADCDADVDLHDVAHLQVAYGM